jgi:hypothetical protein
MRPLVLIALAGVAQALPALAQNALGDGRGLQRTGVFEPRQLDLATELRLRNAVVTGTALGGRSLRIPQPYADPDDFRASLGSDSLFRFRRDSYSANPGAVGLRGTESLQYQYAFTTGNAAPGAILTRFSTTPVRPSPLVAPRPQLTPSASGGADAIAPELNTLRSTASFWATRSLSPAVVGMRATRDGMQRVTASPSLGVRTTMLVPDMQTGQYVEARNPLAAPLASPASSLSPGAPAPGAQPVLETRTVYEDLLERLRSRPAPRPPTPPEPSGEQPAPTPPLPVPAPGAEPRKPDAPAPSSPETLAPWESELRALRERLTQRGITGDRGDRKVPPLALDPDSPEVRRRLALAGADEELLRAIREAGIRAESYLAANPNPGDLYASYIKEGQDFIAQRRFFDAEEWFARALAMRPGDVTAMIGRLHAELGAGLFLSGAVNLRQLYELNPETIGMRFSGPTIPDAERLSTLKADLTERLDRASQPGGRPAPEAALLLAYVGHLTEDRTLIVRGLEALEAQRAAQAADQGLPPPEPDPLLPVLRAIWLGENPSEPVAPGEGR